MQPTLLVLAAGMGSRYGGVKQLDSVGKNGGKLFLLLDAILKKISEKDSLIE